MWRVITAGALCLTGCGRIAFDRSGPADADVPDAPAVGPLVCGSSRVIAQLSAVPLGLGLAVNKAGALILWNAGIASDQLSAIRIEIDDDAIVSAEPKSTTLSERIGDFGFVGDGDAHYMLSAQVASGALLVPIDSGLHADASAMIAGASVTHHAVAEPILAGAAFAAAWVEGGEARMSLLAATGAPTGMVHVRPAGRDIAVRRAAERDIVVWTSTMPGCEVWALDAGFAPVLPDPLVHAPGGACLRSAITRHDAGVNLLAWIAGGDAHAQLGTDTDVVGPELAIGSTANELEIATAGSGFFVAVASADAVTPGYVRTDATGWTTLAGAPHIRGAPLRLISYPGGALLLTIGAPASAPALQLTRLCEPGASARSP